MNHYFRLLLGLIMAVTVALRQFPVALANGNLPAANVLKKWQSLPGIVRMNHDGQMTFKVIGVADIQCDIEASVDLKKWSRVGQVILENGRGSFLDARRIWLPRCFYRAKVTE